MPVMEKQSGGVEFRQSPNRKNHHEHQKSGKFGAFVIGAQHDFHDPHRNQHELQGLTNAASVPHRG